MIHFQEPTLADRAWILPLLAEEGLPLCSYSFPVLFCWKDSFHFKVARLGDRLLVRLRSIVGHSYLWPVGKGDPRPALEAIAADARAHDEPLRLVALTLYHKNWLEDAFPGRFTFRELRDAFDYLYSVDKLADLPGKKLHAKRNHLHRLDDLRPGWTCQPMTAEDIPDCKAMNELWFQQALERESPEGLETLEEERRALFLAMDNKEALGLDGVVLRWPGDQSRPAEVLAFAMGAPLTENVYDIHFERAQGQIQGAYAAINQAFARFVRKVYPQIRYLDREDDMGLEGLRKAKLSYHPEYLEENYVATENPAP